MTSMAMLIRVDEDSRLFDANNDLLSCLNSEIRMPLVMFGVYRK